MKETKMRVWKLDPRSGEELKKEESDSESEILALFCKKT